MSNSILPMALPLTDTLAQISLGHWYPEFQSAPYDHRSNVVTNLFVWRWFFGRKLRWNKAPTCSIYFMGVDRCNGYHR